MNIYISKLNGYFDSATVQYAQVMCAQIGHQLGYKEMGIYGFPNFVEPEDLLNNRLDGIIGGVNSGDIVILQYPTWNGIGYDDALVNKLHSYGCKVIIFMHDFSPYMGIGFCGPVEDHISILNMSDAVVFPTSAMRDRLQEEGLSPEIPYVFQEIWDYTLDGINLPNPMFTKIIHFPGDPEKFTFVKEWTFDVPLCVYSMDECKGANVINKPWMDQKLLTYELSKGGFGLVWYAEEAWKNYMTYNNSFKLSAILAAGIPVIVPRGISNQKLLEDNGLAIVADTLDEAVEKVSQMTAEEYQQMTENVARFASLLRDGYFTKKCLIESVHKVLRRDM